LGHFGWKVQKSACATGFSRKQQFLTFAPGKPKMVKKRKKRHFLAKNAQKCEYCPNAVSAPGDTTFSEAEIPLPQSALKRNHQAEGSGCLATAS